MSRALRAAAHEAAERMGHLMEFSGRAIRQLEEGLPPPPVSDVVAYRRLAITALRKLTKFPQATVPISRISFPREESRTSVAKLARDAIVLLSLGLISPESLIHLVVALNEVREEVPPAAPARRKSRGRDVLELGEAAVLRALPQRTGPTIGDLFGDLR